MKKKLSTFEQVIIGYIIMGLIIAFTPDIKIISNNYDKLQPFLLILGVSIHYALIICLFFLTFLILPYRISKIYTFRYKIVEKNVNLYELYCLTFGAYYIPQWNHINYGSTKKELYNEITKHKNEIIEKRKEFFTHRKKITHTIEYIK